MKAVIIGGYRHTVESPRFHCPMPAELWLQSTSARAWQWTLYDWSRWFDVHQVEPNSFYPGIKVMRHDVYDWYVRQGSERPIYMTQAHPTIIGSKSYPIDHITATFGAGHFGCQLDYMAALALDEGFDHWILYGLGQPYCVERDGQRAAHYLKHHGHFLYWLREAVKRDVRIILDTPESNLWTKEMILDEERYPTPPPIPLRYGYDMSVEAAIAAGVDPESHPFAAANG